MGRITQPKLGAASTKLLGTPDVRLESQPVEIVEDPGLVLGAAPGSIVVLDAKHHFAAAFARGAPDPDRVEDVADVEVAGGTRSEARTHEAKLVARFMAPVVVDRGGGGVRPPHQRTVRWPDAPASAIPALRYARASPRVRTRCFLFGADSVEAL